MTAPRQRRYRERFKAGRAIFAVELDVVGLEHLLEQARLLPAGADHSHHDVQLALSRLIETLIADA
ncbi:MAG: hypothetical protein AUI16_27760 [Alphaproteobacteria bacterium 13_2_20CM_2_64_7]|nr:MAG: hypothetical protein AUI16_27760 [Alphaproteobacteria bacterium 13_2_20CM_2_64_7]